MQLNLAYLVNLKAMTTEFCVVDKNESVSPNNVCLEISH